MQNRRNQKVNFRMCPTAVEICNSLTKMPVVDLEIILGKLTRGRHPYLQSKKAKRTDYVRAIVKEIVTLITDIGNSAGEATGGSDPRCPVERCFSNCTNPSRPPGRDIPIPERVEDARSRPSESQPPAKWEGRSKQKEQQLSQDPITKKGVLDAITAEVAKFDRKSLKSAKDRKMPTTPLIPKSGNRTTDKKQSQKPASQPQPVPAAAGAPVPPPMPPGLLVSRTGFYTFYGTSGRKKTKQTWPTMRKPAKKRCRRTSRK